ncbi:adenylate kinase [Halarsenatibacter silvermanii]|uniref:Adenylate kinase n=1 Tax=Halarsenatibacter silvermanii TaxID=321763 RepID=A0A1G9NBS5_9FIRM|nr:adenylate kinase [Halarsenatibacter silvermanii]SDL83904.1 Adenylate kinase [Halarsenatibacter silvermanii]
MNLVLMGLPGAGKGTQAGLLEEKYEIPHVSTGDMFRAAIKNETELGKEAKSYMDEGELVPDEVTIGIVRERLKKPDCQGGFILDGFPRTVEQAEALDEILENQESSLDLVISMVLPEDELMKRLTGRRVCPECGENYHTEYSPPEKEGVCDRCGAELIQRSDDREDTVKRRLEVNREKIKNLQDYYQDRDLLVEFDASGDVEEVHGRFVELLEDSL